MTAVGRRTWSALPWALWTLITPLGLTTLFLLDHGLRRYPTASGEWLHASDSADVVAVVASASVGALVAWRRPRHPVGWLLLALGFLMVETGIVEAYIAFGLLAHRPAPGAAVLGALDNKQFVGWLAVTSLALLLTPSGRLPSPRWRAVGWGCAVLPALAFGASVVLPGHLNPPFDATANVLAVPAIEDLAAIAVGIGFIGTNLVLLVCAASLVVRFRRARGEERQQLLWVAFGAAVTLVGVVGQLGVVALLPAPRRSVVAGSIAGVFLAAIPLSIGVAVLQYRLYDLGRVVRRAATYAVLSVLLVVVYVLSAALVGQAVGSPALIVIVAVSAVMAGGAVTRLQTEIDRRFNRRRYRAIRQLEEFARRPLRAEVGESIESVLGRALDDPALTVAYRVSSNDMWVDGSGRPVAPGPASGRCRREVRRDAQLVATVTHAADIPEAVIAPVLETASGELDNARLRAELGVQLSEVRASRTRILNAADAERRRIERNLHDGAQQRLVAVALDLRASRIGVQAEAPLVPAIDRAVDELGRAIKELRDLASGLHPSILGEEGLVAALEAVADRSPLDVRLQADVESLAPDVEATAYYIACEAITNAAKHAHACVIDVVVSSQTGGLVIEISDDGVGGADMARGTGLRGLVDRVDALGGQIDVASPSGSGTTVRAVLPCVS